MTTVSDDLIRAFLAEEARRAVAAAPSLDEAVCRLAPRIGGRPSGASQRLTVLLAATLLLVAALATAIAVGSGILRLPVVIDDPVDLGIFEPVAGRIVYCENDDLWSVDPSAPDPASTLERVDPEGTGDPDRPCASFTVPLGWSSDGTALLFALEDRTPQPFPYDRHLYILHADGTQTQVTPEPVLDDAAISPDGSRVAFVAADGMFVVDAEGGEPVMVANWGGSPTFSPDGTRIAYLGLPRSECCVPARREHVWVVNADGTGAHEILAGEPALASGVFGLTWSPAGDRIAMEDTGGRGVIYTFAPDGSDFTEVITGGFNPYWSPDGSRIAYGLPGRGGFSIADADGSNVRTFGFGASGPWHPGDSTEGEAR